MPESPHPFEQDPTPGVESRLSLRSQWQDNIRALNESGVLEYLPEPKDLGILGLDGRPYAFPKEESILEALKEGGTELEVKQNQGFAKLLITPMAMPLDRLVSRYRDLLIKHHKQGQLFDSQGRPLDLDPQNPIYVWDQYQGADHKETLIYYPKEFSANHQGLTKRQLIQQTKQTLFPGFEVKLIETFADIPAQGQGQIIGGRAQLEANKTPREYLTLLQTLAPYKLEQGFTPEDWLSLAILTLKTKNQVIDDWQGSGKSCYLTGSYFPGFRSVPFGYWDRVDRQAYLGGPDPDVRDSGNGARSAVRLGVGELF